MPYILVGVPVCALLFALIPLANSLFMMMATIILFNLVMSTWRSPVVALMPDVTPPVLRSKANGVINLMGGVGSIIALLGGGYLVKVTGSYEMPYLMVSVVMIAAVIVLFFFVKEADSRRSKIAQEAYVAEVSARSGDNALQRCIRWLNSPGLFSRIGAKIATTCKAVLALFKIPEKRSLIFILLAIFFWFAGFNAVEAFFTLFATQKMGISAGDASMTLAIFSLALVGFALPSGIIAGHVGRKRMIMIGLAGIIVVFIPMIFLEGL